MYLMRSERQFCERLQYDLLFKWFLDLNVDDRGFEHSTFAKNRERLLEHEIADEFFAAVVQQAKLRRYISDEHFTVDGTLLEAWASTKSFRPRDTGSGDGGGSNPDVNFHGEQRSNLTHCSTTDPEARLARKGNGKEAKLCYAGHVFMENRNGLVVDAELSAATGDAERTTALTFLERRPLRKRCTIAGDKGYDTHPFVEQCRALKVTPHVAQNTINRRSAIDERTTRHPGYLVSQRKRKRVEEIFGSTKTVGNGRKLR
jgi:hypothetical protein